MGEGSGESVHSGALEDTAPTVLPPPRAPLGGQEKDERREVVPPGSDPHPVPLWGPPYPEPLCHSLSKGPRVPESSPFNNYPALRPSTIPVRSPSKPSDTLPGNRDSP